MWMQKIVLFTASLLSVAISAQTTASVGCTNPSIRKEIRELSYDEFNRYTNAIKKLHSKYAKAGDLSDFEKFSQKHSLTSDYIHRDPSFLPWHREFLFQYEKSLRVIDPLVTLPYWDWSLDCQYPHDSVVLSQYMLGGNGFADEDLGTYCVFNGAFANMHLEYADDQGPHCLSRAYNQGRNLSSFTSPEVLVTSLNEKTFSTFSFKSEIYHGSPHDNIGGDYGDFSTMYSPSDPLFYLHHAFIDLLWSKWQDKNPSVALTYEGVKYKKTVKLTDSLRNFKPLLINDTLSIKSPRYCYQYPAYPRLVSSPDYASPSYQDLLVKNQTSSQPANSSSTILSSSSSVSNTLLTTSSPAASDSLSNTSNSVSQNPTNSQAFDMSPTTASNAPASPSPSAPASPSPSPSASPSPIAPASPNPSVLASSSPSTSTSPSSNTPAVSSPNATDAPYSSVPASSSQSSFVASGNSSIPTLAEANSTSTSTNGTTNNAMVRRGLINLGDRVALIDLNSIPAALLLDPTQSKLVETVSKDLDVQDVTNLNEHTIFGKKRQNLLNLDAEALVKNIRKNYNGGKRAKREIRKPKKLSSKWILRNKFTPAEVDEVLQSAEAVVDALATIPDFESIAAINGDIDTKKEVVRKRKRMDRNTKQKQDENDEDSETEKKKAPKRGRGGSNRYKEQFNQDED